MEPPVAESRLQRLPDGEQVVSVEFTVWFNPDGTVPLDRLVDLIVAELNACDIKGVRNGWFRHPFAKEYGA